MPAVVVNFLIPFHAVNMLAVMQFLMLIKNVHMNAITDYLAVLLDSNCWHFLYISFC